MSGIISSVAAIAYYVHPIGKAIRSALQYWTTGITTSSDNPLADAVKDGEPLSIIAGLILPEWLSKGIGVSGSLPIHYAASQGRVDVIRLFIQQDPELVNAPNRDGKTALHWAVTGHHPEKAFATTVYLLSQQADAGAEDHEHRRPVDLISHIQDPFRQRIVSLLNGQLPGGTGESSYSL